MIFFIFDFFTDDWDKPERRTSTKVYHEIIKFHAPVIMVIHNDVKAQGVEPAAPGFEKAAPTISSTLKKIQELFHKAKNPAGHLVNQRSPSN